MGRATFAYDAAAVEGTFGRSGALDGRTRIFHKDGERLQVRSRKISLSKYSFDLTCERQVDVLFSVHAIGALYLRQSASVVTVCGRLRKRAGPRAGMDPASRHVQGRFDALE